MSNPPLPEYIRKQNEQRIAEEIREHARLLNSALARAVYAGMRVSASAHVQRNDPRYPTPEIAVAVVEDMK